MEMNLAGGGGGAGHAGWREGWAAEDSRGRQLLRWSRYPVLGSSNDQASIVMENG